MLFNLSTEEIIGKLSEKGANHPCARCGKEDFELITTTLVPIQVKMGITSVGGESIPAAVVACSNCGNLSYHALGALGLLERSGK